jgi:GNAT superfamily N-acetyltransferase
MALRKVSASASERDAASRTLLSEYEALLVAQPGRAFHELVWGLEALLARGDVRAALWLDDRSAPSGLVLWDFMPGVGRRVRVYFGPQHRSAENLARLLDELDARSEHEGSVASVVDYIPGVSREAQEATFSARGFFPVERLVFRLDAEVPIPDETLAGMTDLRPIDAGDEEALVTLMRDAYDPLAGETAPWLFYRDPKQDAREAVREILEGRRGEWLPWASFGIDIGGVLRGASLVTRWDVPILSEVMVAPSFRGIGLGYYLALGSARALRERDVGALHTVTTSHDLRALRLCRRIGFEPADRSAVGLWVSRAAVGAPSPRPGGSG